MHRDSRCTTGTPEWPSKTWNTIRCRIFHHPITIKPTTLPPVPTMCLLLTYPRILTRLRYIHRYHRLPCITVDQPVMSPIKVRWNRTAISITTEWILGSNLSMGVIMRIGKRTPEVCITAIATATTPVVTNGTPTTPLRIGLIRRIRARPLRGTMRVKRATTRSHA